MLAKHALSQLSYSPTWLPQEALIAFRGPGAPAAEVVGLGRVELPTSPLSGVRSNQLSYRPSLANHAGHVTWPLPRRPTRRAARSPAALTILIQKRVSRTKVEHAGQLR